MCFFNPNAKYARTWDDLKGTACLGALTMMNPYIGIPVGLTDTFYPGGFGQAIKDRAQLEEERRRLMGERRYLPLTPKSYF